MTIMNMVGGGAESDIKIQTFNDIIYVGYGYMSGNTIRQATTSFTQYSPTNVSLCYIPSDFKIIISGSYSTTSNSGTYYKNKPTMSFNESKTAFIDLLNSIATTQSKTHYNGTATIKYYGGDFNNSYMYTKENVSFTYDNGNLVFNTDLIPASPSKVTYYSDSSTPSYRAYITNFTLNE